MSFLLTIPAAGWLILSALFFAGGEYLSKRWGIDPNWRWAVLTVFTYALGSAAWLPVLLHKNQIAIMGTAWLLLAMVATLAVGLLIFHERVNGLQIAGIVLALAALLLLNIS